MLDWVRTRLSPPIFEDEERTRIASLLNTIVLTTLALSILFMVAAPAISPNLLFSWVVTGVLLLPQLGAFFLLRRGRVQLGSLLFSSMLWSVITLSAFLAAGTRSASFNTYTVVILIVGLLLGWRAVLVFVGLSVVSGLGMLYAESSDFLPSPLIADTPTSLWAAQTTAFMAAAALLYLATRSIVTALERARRNERALAASNRELVAEIAERKRVEEALRESEERFRRLAENAPDIIFRWSVAGGLDYISPIVYEVTGYTPQELVANPMLGFELATGNDPQLVADYQGVLVGGTAMPSRVFPVTRKDGSTAYLDVRSSAVKENGQVVAFEGILRDVTEQRRAEAVLRENEARYRALFEQSPISLWEEDFFQVKCYLDGLSSLGVSDLGAYFAECPEAVADCARQIRVLNVNQATLRLLKAQTKDDLHAGLDAVFTSESQDLFRKELIALFGGATHFTGESTHRTMTGDLLDVMVSLVVVPGYEDTWSKVFVSIMDITRRKRIERERVELLSTLERRSTQLQTAAEVAKSAITLLDPQALMDETVKLIQERFGLYYVGIFLVDEAGKYAVLRAGSGEAGRLMLEAGHRLRIGGRSMIGWCVANLEARVALDIGQDAVHFNNPFLPETRSELALPLLSRGRYIGALTVQSVEEAAFSEEDIFALETMADQLAITIDNARLYKQVQQHAARLESRVAERTAELETVNKELEAFAYSVSHDLRAPLRSIDGFSQALLEDCAGELDAVGRDYLCRVRAASQRMGQLIDDLLRLSRLTRGKLRWETVDLSALARAIVADLRATQPERRVEFVIARGIVAKGDPQLLQAVLENLLGNAWKFTSKHPRARIQLGVTQQDGESIYFVRDDGAGFDMAYADKLFGAFQRLHGTTEFEGTGVGLATVQRIIHRHGGRIWVEGAVEQGATFYFTLSTKGGGTQ